MQYWCTLLYVVQVSVRACVTSTPQCSLGSWWWSYPPSSHSWRTRSWLSSTYQKLTPAAQLLHGDLACRCQHVYRPCPAPWLHAVSKVRVPCTSMCANHVTCNVHLMCPVVWRASRQCSLVPPRAPSPQLCPESSGNTHSAVCIHWLTWSLQGWVDSAVCHDCITW